MINNLQEEILGFVFHGPYRDSILDAVTAADLPDYQCSRAYAAAEALYARGQIIDPLTVAAESGCDLEWIERVKRSVNWSALTVDAHVQVLTDLNTCRLGRHAAEDLRTTAEEGTASEVLTMVETLPLRFAARQMDVHAPLTADEIAAMTFESRWLIDGVMERTDRALIVGKEGGGKSVLLRQIAVMVAGGLDPWRRHEIQPLRVLILDLENTLGQIARSFRGLLAHGALQSGTGGRVQVECRPQGMDLCSRSDVRWLDGLVGKVRPDLLCFGSLYKAFRGADGRGKASEEAAEMVIHALDAIRVKHDCAMVIEAHAPHGDGGDRSGWRPAGSSLWLRWPEVGLGMKPLPDGSVDMVPFRGFRNAEVRRNWPDGLVRGHVWPWEATWK